MQGGKNCDMIADNEGHGLISMVNTEAHPIIQAVPQLWQTVCEVMAQQWLNVNCSDHR
jgi:hypothetical protein